MMYAYIKGQLTQLFPTHVVVETQGIGYEIQTPNSYRFQQFYNQAVTIYTSLIVREDAQLLYGFINEEEKEMFLNLIKVTGIGPKSALAILATSTPNEVKRAIEDENDAYLIMLSYQDQGDRTIIHGLKVLLLILRLE